MDKLANEYAAAGKPAVFLEQNVDSPLGNRKDIWWDAWRAGGGGSWASLPWMMVDSGHQISNGVVDHYNTYKAMVDAALARPPKAAIAANSQRIGNKLHFDIQLTNLSGVTLSSSNAATVYAVVYEEHTPVDPNVDHITGRIVRAVVSTGISPALANGAIGTFTLETAELSGVDWSKIHTVVFADYRPDISSRAHDMLQAASPVVMTVSKQDAPDPVQAGALLTYTIRVVNNGYADLHATVTDTLPAHVTYTGPLVWKPTITTSGGVWEYTFAVTVETGYTGTLVNRVQVTTDEGETGEGVAITNGIETYLPTIMKSY